MFAFLGGLLVIRQHISDRQDGTTRTKQQRADQAAAIQRMEADRASPLPPSSPYGAASRHR